MSEILIQDPGSNEAQSPLIAGLTEGLNKISKILNLQTGTLTDEPLRNVPISESDKNRIYQAQDGKRLWLSSPAPTFKKNGSPITQEQAQFSIDYVGGSISFNELGRLGDSDKVTVSCTYIISTSKTITDLTNSLSATSNVANRYKGSYASLSALQSAHATASVGDFAVVQSPGAVFIWTGSAWKNTQSIEDLSVYYKKTEVDNLLNKKEPTISKHGDTTSDDNFFYGGRKTWVDLYSKVRSATLTGLSTATNSAISATDTVLSAFGKLQAQVSGATAKAFLTGTGAPTTSTKGAVGQRYVNTSNGDWYTCTAAGSTYTWEQGQEKITSLKNPYALTISLNGTSQGAYDGSAAKSFNITPSAIGAAAASHTQAASTITGLTANRALVSDTNGHPAVSPITNVELEYLDGVTSNIQTQLNGKATSAQGSKADSAVQSVNGKTGTSITLSYGDVGALSATGTAKKASVLTNDKGDFEPWKFESLDNSGNPFNFYLLNRYMSNIPFFSLNATAGSTYEYPVCSGGIQCFGPENEFDKSYKWVVKSIYQKHIPLVFGLETIGYDSGTKTKDCSVKYAVQLTTSSSLRYKSDVKKISDSDIQKFLDLSVIDFLYNDSAPKTLQDGKRHYGLVAEEVYESFSDSVLLDEDNLPSSVIYSDFIPLIIQVCKNQSSKIKELEERIKTLESK